MSGIAGIIHFDGAPVEPGQVEAMTAAMAHRGPDGIHHWVKGNVALGQCMLRTTPESLEETQPLANEDESLVLVMDGRVDNWEELRRELLGRGAVLRTRADAELVLRAYEVWGKDCLPHIDGDFALAVWDARQRQVFCARDRIGNKPLYYQWDGNTFAFASELHPILALPWVNREPNDGMVAEFLAAEWFSREETLWLGIMRLAPASQLEVRARGLRPAEYWAPDLQSPLPYKNDDDFVAHYRDLFTDTVRRKSRSHLPVACEVSGGLDSSAVFCVAECLRHSSRLPSPGTKAYTLSFADEGAANEMAYARQVGAYLGAAVHEIAASFPPLAWYLDEAHSSKEFPGFPNALMFREMRRQISHDGSRVLLTGEGGDEWFQGSRTYYAEELSHGHWRELHACLTHDFQVLGAHQTLRIFARHGLFPLLPIALQDLTRHLARATRTQNKKGAYWLSPAMENILAARRKGHLASMPSRRASPWHGERLDALYDALSDHVMSRSERLGAQFGIETRYPFRDHRIVQFAFSIPERMCLQGDTKKLLHTQAMQDLMPEPVLTRKDKAEFSIVFRKNLDQMKTLLTTDLPNRQPGWFAKDGLSALYRFYADNPEAGWPQWTLWSIFGCDALLQANAL